MVSAKDLELQPSSRVVTPFSGLIGGCSGGGLCPPSSCLPCHEAFCLGLFSVRWGLWVRVRDLDSTTPFGLEAWRGWGLTVPIWLLP